MFGVRSLPEDVYRFAKGSVIEHAAGYPIQISRPLDFAAVTDHAEYLGRARLADLDVPTNRSNLPDVLANGDLFEITRQWLSSSVFVLFNGMGHGAEKVNPQVNRSAWETIIYAAEEANDPGVFSAFIGYEWSSFIEGKPSVHNHRNVIYRGSEVSARPFSAVDSNKPEDLWAFLEQESNAGRTAFAIPHNANISGGNMYPSADSNGEPLTSVYSKQRNRFEPVGEILQIKGASETHPLLSSLDEFANFELLTDDAPLEELKGSYARDALRLGLELSHQEGFNPYRFGVIGSSDSHNASSPTEESRFHGKLPVLDGSAGLRTNAALMLPELINPALRWGSGGLAAVWAEENTRASLFDAMQRRETYATSGPRITVRFFAGWSFDTELLADPDWLERADSLGVPMGGVLPPGTMAAPNFAVSAQRDPESGNLDRIQIIKGWITSDGTSREKVFDTVWSGDREPDSQGVLPPVGNTVDVASASYSNSIGAEQLSAVWTDPEFDASDESFYYARVLEIPTPRVSTYDAKALGIEAPEPASIQERAITSAIWYRPDE